MINIRQSPDEDFCVARYYDDNDDRLHLSIAFVGPYTALAEEDMKAILHEANLRAYQLLDIRSQKLHQQCQLGEE